MFQQGALFGAAFVKTAGMHKTVNGFERTGLWPFNPDVFCDDFLPSQVTDEPELVPAANIESETCLAPDMPENPVEASTADSVGDNVDASLALTCEEGHVANAAVSSVDITTCHSAVASDSFKFSRPSWQ